MMNDELFSVFAILLVVLFIVSIDQLRKRKADRLNRNGLCARCGKPLGYSDDFIPVSGGGISLGFGRACHKCAAAVKLQYKILYFTLALAFLVTIVSVI